MDLKINFVNSGTDALASYRMRSEIPANLLETPGPEDMGFTTSISSECSEEADINVFSKHWNQEEDLHSARKSRTKTVFDICDDHFDRDNGAYYEAMCDAVDTITCNTANMQERIYEVTGRLASIIPDPVTFDVGSASMLDFDNPKFLWFGSAPNVMTIYSWLHKVPNLTVICNMQIPHLPEKVKFVPWGPGVVEKLIQEHDIVILPKNKHEWARTKSPNRAVDAIYAGKYVISDFEEVYGELSPYMYVGRFEDGMEHFNKNHDQVINSILAGQDYIARNFGSPAIRSAWAKALTTEGEET
jgi:hypothetical protein